MKAFCRNLKSNSFNKLYLLSFMKFDLRSFSKINFKFVYLADQEEVKVEADEGQHLLEIAKANQVNIEGACEASLACSTCHVIIPKEIYQNLPSPKEEEEDLLDLTFGLQETSRLGCQVKVTKEFEGATILVPKATRNLYDDDKGAKSALS